MGKLIVRLTIVITAVYIAIAFLLANILGIDIMTDDYTFLFELCVVVYCFSEGKYHCKYLKFVALAILICDTLTKLDIAYNFLSVSAHILIPLYILGISIGIGIVKAFIHFYKVLKLKRNARKQLN